MHKKWLYENDVGRDFTFIIPNNPILESCHLLSFLVFFSVCMYYNLWDKTQCFGSVYCSVR